MQIVVPPTSIEQSHFTIPPSIVSWACRSHRAPLWLIRFGSSSRTGRREVGPLLGRECTVGCRSRRALFDRRLAQNSFRTCGLLDHQQGLAAADGRRRQRRNQHDALFRQPGNSHYDRAHHGIRRAAASVPGHQNRRPVLLGRRHSFQHADRGDFRRCSATHFPDFCGPLVESDRGPSRDRSGRPCTVRKMFNTQAGLLAISPGSSRPIGCATSSVNWLNRYRLSGAATTKRCANFPATVARRRCTSCACSLRGSKMKAIPRI